MDGSLNGETWRFIVRNIRIGVVEDDPASCQLVLDYLNRYQSETGEQFTVSVFDDGARIVEKYAPVYDILLLDIEMKEMDGMAAARRIRERDDNVVIIFITAVADGSLLSGMSSMDIASLFGNALDNAIEATSKLPKCEQRLIKLALYEQNHFIVIRVENYYDSRLKKDAEGNLRTTKRDDQHRHGFGVKSIRHITQQYGGEVTIRTEDHWFVLTALIPKKTGLMAI